MCERWMRNTWARAQVRARIQVRVRARARARVRVKRWMRSTAVIGTASIMPVRPHTCEGRAQVRGGEWGCTGCRMLHAGVRGV